MAPKKNQRNRSLGSAPEGYLSLVDVDALTRTEEASDAFCFEKGLYARRMICAKRSCRREMSLQKTPARRTKVGQPAGKDLKQRDGKIWRCPAKRCGSIRSIRTGSPFFHSRLRTSVLLRLLHLYCEDVPIFVAARLMRRIVTEGCVTLTYDHFRGYISRNLISDPIWFEGTVVAGSGDPLLEAEDEEPTVSVEADETLTGKKSKGGRGRSFPRYSAMGIVEKAGTACVLELIPDRTETTLCGVIERHVSRTCHVFTDGLSSYGSLARRGYVHSTVNHSQEFVTADGVHSNTIEGVFGLFKQWVCWRHGCHSKERLAAYLDEFQFRQSYKEAGSIWLKMLEIMCSEVEAVVRGMLA